MKLFHIQYVQRCKNENECRFGPSKCWFAHQKNIKNAYQKEKGDVLINDNDLNYDMERNQELRISTKFKQKDKYLENNSQDKTKIKMNCLN